MGNSHFHRGKARPVEGALRDREFGVKLSGVRLSEEQGDAVMREFESRKKFGARVESARFTPFTSARPGLRYLIGVAPRPVDCGLNWGGDVEQWKHLRRKTDPGAPALP